MEEGVGAAKLTRPACCLLGLWPGLACSSRSPGPNPGPPPPWPRPVRHADWAGALCSRQAADPLYFLLPISQGRYHGLPLPITLKLPTRSQYRRRTSARPINAQRCLPLWPIRRVCSLGRFGDWVFILLGCRQDRERAAQGSKQQVSQPANEPNKPNKPSQPARPRTSPFESMTWPLAADADGAQAARQPLFLLGSVEPRLAAHLECHTNPANGDVHGPQGNFLPKSPLWPSPLVCLSEGFIRRWHVLVTDWAQIGSGLGHACPPLVRR